MMLSPFSGLKNRFPPAGGGRKGFLGVLQTAQVKPDIVS